jgi:cell division septation protein DedD
VDSAELPGFVLQVAAMKHEENAYTLVESLQRRNLPVFVFRLGLGGFYRVAVGVYRDAAAAATAKRELETQGFKTVLKPWRPDKALGETASRAIATGSPIARNSYIR